MKTESPLKLVLLESLAQAPKQELDASLDHLVGEGKIRASQAAHVSARVSRLRKVIESRQEVINAVDGLTTYYINSVGQKRTPKSESQALEAHERFTTALDMLIDYLMVSRGITPAGSGRRV